MQGLEMADTKGRRDNTRLLILRNCSLERLRARSTLIVDCVFPCVGSGHLSVHSVVMIAWGCMVWCIVNPRKLEHGFRMINAGIPYTLP